jgi:peptide/nickel transport system substrate-binding protein
LKTILVLHRKSNKHIVIAAATALLILVSLSQVLASRTLAAPQLPPREKILIVDIDAGRVADPTNWNWMVPGTRRDQGYHQLILEKLFYINFETGEVIPWLAESYEYKDNYTKFIIHLRKGVAWSDGAPFTADDIVFTYETMLKYAPQLAYSSDVKEWVKSVRKIDDYTVEVTLTKPNPRFHLLAIAFTQGVWGGMEVLPKHVWEGKDPLTFKFYPPIGTGPYVLVEASETRFVYKRRDDWWATKVFGIRPAPEYVIYVWYGPEETRVMRMARHELDSICDITPGAFLSLKEKNPYVVAWYADVPYAWLDPCPRYISIPWTRYPWNIPEVRRALSYLVNREELIKIAYEYSSIPSWGLYPFYGGLKPYFDAIKDLLEKYDWVIKYDPKKAEEIFKSLGFKKGPDGVWVTPNGTRLALTIIAPSPWIEILRNAVVVANQWKAAGIDVVVKTLEAAPFFDAIYRGQYEAASYWHCPPGPSEAYLITSTLHSRYVVPVAVEAAPHLNVERYRNPELDKILDEWAMTPPENIEKCKELFRKAMEIWLRDLPQGIPLSQARKLIPFDTYYWVGWPTADNPWIHPCNWWASFLLVITGYRSPRTGEWVGGIRPAKIDYTTIYFTKDTSRFRGIDLTWYGPYKAGEAARIPVDDAEFWIRQGYASYTPPIAAPAIPPELSAALSKLESGVSDLQSRVTAIESSIRALATTTTLAAALAAIATILVLVELAILIRIRKTKTS